jgi:hypothetical protein
MKKIILSFLFLLFAAAVHSQNFIKDFERIPIAAGLDRWGATNHA